MTEKKVISKALGWFSRLLTYLSTKCIQKKINNFVLQPGTANENNQQQSLATRLFFMPTVLPVSLGKPLDADTSRYNNLFKGLPHEQLLLH